MVEERLYMADEPREDEVAPEAGGIPVGRPERPDDVGGSGPAEVGEDQVAPEAGGIPVGREERPDDEGGEGPAEPGDEAGETA